MIPPDGIGRMSAGHTIISTDMIPPDGNNTKGTGDKNEKTGTALRRKGKKGIHDR